MGKVLILRTFRHSKIWDNWAKQEVFCHFENSSVANNKKTILQLEPNLINMKTSEISFALGIYMNKYFEEKKADKGTPDERKISLLEVDWFDRGIFDTDKDEIFAKVSGEILRIRTKRPILKKLDSTLEQMFKFDDEVLRLCLNNSTVRVEYPPLCFLLEENLVKEKLEEVGINL